MSRHFTAAVLCAALLAWAGPRSLLAQPIGSSRLGLTKLPSVLAAGRVQLETGYSRAEVEDRTRETIGEILLRGGIGAAVELRLGLPSYLRSQSPAATTDGRGDAYAAIRRRVIQGKGWVPTATLQAATTIPVGSDGIGAGKAQPEIGGYAMWQPGGGVQLLAMGVHRAAVAVDDRFGQSTLSVGARRDLLPGVTVQADYGLAHATRAGAVDARLWRASGGVRAGASLQLDAWVGGSRSAGKHELQLGIGMARRW